VITDPLFILVAVVAVTFLGLAKGGLPASAWPRRR
jgi:hypothetical protein